jgi:hypothetical protein
MEQETKDVEVVEESSNEVEEFFAAATQGDSDDDSTVPVEGAEPAKEESEGEAGKESVESSKEPAPGDTFTWEGKEYTLAEAKESGLLEKLLTRAHQAPHNHKLYEGARQKLEALEKQLEQASVTQPKALADPEQQRKQNDQVVQQMAPMMKQLTDNGFIDEEIMEIAPKFATMAATTILQLRAGLQKMHEDLAPVIEFKKELEAAYEQETTATGVVDAVTKAGQAEGYEAMLEKEIGEDFLKWTFSENNPIPVNRSKQIAPEVMQGLWVIYLQSNPAAADAVAKLRSSAPAPAAAPGTSGNVGTSPGDEVAEFMRASDRF